MAWTAVSSALTNCPFFETFFFYLLEKRILLHFILNKAGCSISEDPVACGQGLWAVSSSSYRDTDDGYRNNIPCLTLLGLSGETPTCTGRNTPGGTGGLGYTAQCNLNFHDTLCVMALFTCLSMIVCVHKCVCACFSVCARDVCVTDVCSHGCVCDNDMFTLDSGWKAQHPGALFVQDDQWVTVQHPHEKMWLLDGQLVNVLSDRDTWQHVWCWCHHTRHCLEITVRLSTQENINAHHHLIYC